MAIEKNECLKILVTGSAGFIGFHLARLLLRNGHIVLGLDAMTDYYDVSLKRKRHSMLLQNKNFNAIEHRLEDFQQLSDNVENFEPDVIVHLAAQAGVRYSIENPRSYVDSNLIGAFNILEIAKNLSIKHLLMASTSSVYGSNKDMPFNENEKADHQLTLYAATKKANENMAHSYSHIWNIPITMFRFFTVYGPWGRPDLALFKFVERMLNDQPIDIYNHGNMYRDFTYVDDLVRSIDKLIFAQPVVGESIKTLDNLSPVAPFRVVNIGNNQQVRLLDFISEIERQLGVKAKRNYMDMQPGDVPATWANTELLKELTDHQPNTPIRDGIREFISWYKSYYNISGND